MVLLQWFSLINPALIHRLTTVKFATQLDVEA
jgi:hypothetical protein